MTNSNGKTPFEQFRGLRFARESASSLFVPETGAFGRAEIRVPAPPPSPRPGAPRVAMLIDGDNAQPSAETVKRVLNAAQKRGDVTIRRVYANWSGNMPKWSEIARQFAMRPVHQVSTVAGKNAADIALAIDAMDLMLGGEVDGFCIVSSDGDFTGLAIRIREQGMFAVGAGREDTPKSFVNACDGFVFTDAAAAKKPASAPKPAPAPKPQSKPAPKPQPSRPEWARVIAKAIAANKKGDGWANIGAVGNHLKNLTPPFNWKGHGHTKLSDLINSRPDLFEVNKSNTHAKNKH